MRNFFALSIFSGCILTLSSLTSIAFENKIKAKSKILYSFSTILDDYVLNYCSTYDSYTVNRLYSQKKILDEKFNNNKANKFLVSFKEKPLNPNIIKLINQESELKIVNQSINDINLDFLSQSKKDFVKTLLPLISYQSQNILLERSKLEELKASLIDHNTLTNTDLKFLNKISQKYRIKTADKHKYDLVNELLNRVDIIPNSIVLAQAANESGWGSSRFARAVSYTHLTLPTILLV